MIDDRELVARARAARRMPVFRLCGGSRLLAASGRECGGELRKRLLRRYDLCGRAAAPP